MEDGRGREGWKRVGDEDENWWWGRGYLISINLNSITEKRVELVLLCCITWRNMFQGPPEGGGLKDCRIEGG